MSNLLKELNQEMATVIETAGHSLVKVAQGRGNGAGSGTLVHADGLILTNAHVVRDGPVEVALQNEQPIPARILAVDAELDLAALSVEAGDLPTIALGNSKDLQPGQLVFALGHPWGVPGAVSAGSVIDVGLPPEIPRNRRDFIQVSIQLRPGHSGGPMIDALGRLVGLNTMITGPEVGLAVPVDAIKSFLRQHLGSASEQDIIPPDPVLKTI